MKPLFSIREFFAGRSPLTLLKWMAIALLVLGIGFRFVNLGHKVYWTDEVHTSLRISGYTEAEVVQTLYTGKEISVDDLQHYQHPNSEKTLGDVLTVLQGKAEHSPLYFLLARFWTQTLPYSAATIRALSVLISLLVFPCLYWLCLELWRSPPMGWLSLALVAVSPLHVLYAQEARQYSLWIVTIVGSSATLLWAMRRKTRFSWAMYALSIAIGLYTHLLFALVAIAHAFYIGIITEGRNRPIVRPYLIATGAGLATFIPWIVVIVTRINEVQESTEALDNSSTLSRLFDLWFLNLNRALIDSEWGSLNLLLVVFVIYALYFLCRRTPERISWFIVLLVGIPFLALALPDLIVGGQRSLRVRYLFPSFLGIQLAIAYLFTTHLFPKPNRSPSSPPSPSSPSSPHSIPPSSRPAHLRTLPWLLLLTLFLAINIWACCRSAQAEVWWTKSSVKSDFIPPIARLINAVDQPLIMSDADLIMLLSFSYELDPDVRLRLLQHPRQLTLPDRPNPTFLLFPSRRLLNTIKTVERVTLTPVYEENGKPLMWQVE
jgi:uncharacterized membrane protein